MTKTVQEEIRPGLIPVNNRSQILKSLGATASQLKSGSAVAIMGPPGADLHRLAADIIRGIDDLTVIVWIDLANLSGAVPAGDKGEDPTTEDGAWDRGLEEIFRSNFDQALNTEEMRVDGAEPPLVAASSKDATVLDRILKFATQARRMHYWPVIVLESMQSLPWPVSERLQRILRIALDNQDRQQILRLVMTGTSDFLSGEAIAEGTGYHTSPLYERTGRFVVAPFSVDDLWELTPLPGGLPDQLLEDLVFVTGGYVGFLELFMHAIQLDTSLGQALHATFPGGEEEPPAWFWEWLSRAEVLAAPARQLVREGMATLLSNAKGRSRTILEALELLVDGKEVEQLAADALLPLELAGIAGLELRDGRFFYHFSTPLVRPLLMAVLPRGRHLRHRIEAFAAQLLQEAEAPAEGQPDHSPATPHTSVRTTGNRRHVTTTLEVEPEVAPPPVKPSRLPLNLPPLVAKLVDDKEPASARLLIELLREATLAVQRARGDGNRQILTLTQLEIKWLEADNGEGNAGPSLLADPAITAELATGKVRGRWEVRLLPEPLGEASLLEAAALFVPPERIKDLLNSKATGQAFLPQSSDDVYAMGILAGLLLTRETNPRRMADRLEDRLTGATTLSVGPLIRLVARCLDPSPEERPQLEQVTKGLKFVLEDPFARGRSILRHVLLWLLVILIGVALYDFVLDARVDNPNWFYTAIKLVSAAGGAAFYLLAWLMAGKTDRAQVHRELWNFLRQRMNRVRWLVIPSFLATLMIALFAHRLMWSWGVQLSLPPGYRLEEVREREEGETFCESVHKFAQPPEHSSLRLRLDGRAYVFVMLYEDDQGKLRRKEYYWPTDKVRQQRQHSWNDTLDVYALDEPPAGMSCLPVIHVPALPTVEPTDAVDGVPAPDKGLEPGLPDSGEPDGDRAPEPPGTPSFDHLIVPAGPAVEPLEPIHLTPTPASGLQASTPPR